MSGGIRPLPLHTFVVWCLGTATILLIVFERNKCRINAIYCSGLFYIVVY